MDQPREPANLLRAGSALCYDRSRTIEKALALAGFDTRYVFLLNTRPFGAMFGLLKPSVSASTTHSTTHAVIEVETVAGWLVVDSTSPWLSLASDGRPVPLAEVSIRTDWLEEAPYWVREWQFLAFRGLYSRHGRFYAPYGWLPDIDYAQIIG